MNEFFNNINNMADRAVNLLSKKQITMDKKFIEPIVNEEFFVWVAPDGSMQLSLIAPDYATCMAIAKLSHKYGMSQSVFEMRRKGFTIEKVKVNIIPTGEDVPQFKMESAKKFSDK